MPLRSNVMVASYAYSVGNIMLDENLPLKDLNSNLNSMVVGYVRGFKMLNLPTKFDVILPYTSGSFEGIFEEEDASTSRSGFGDPSFRLSMIFLGAKPFSPASVMKEEPGKFKLGAILRVRVPLGQYDNEKLINLGTNRFSIKTGLAGSYTFFNRLTWEVHLNSWFFTPNNQFFNSSKLEQKPLLSLQNHFIYEFKPGMWAALSLGASTLGETSVNGVEKNDLQKNSRFGAAFAYRFKGGGALKFAATTGVTTRYGSDYSTVLLAYQFFWIDKVRSKK